MIRLNNQYAIKADEQCYSLCEIRIAEKDMKTLKEGTKEPIRAGDEYLVPMGCYSGTVNHCIDVLIRKLQRDAVAEADMSLAEAARVFCGIENLVHRWAEGAKEAGT